ncbi:hypothetical protein [uncultured Sphingomonas sp.]|uniref:hypothetical protein n=1 Tax=uncultured Sphingomonas sp. TaxID=158754 RepID=UPI0035CBB58B
MHADPNLAPSVLTVCIAENRDTCEPALRILVASLARECPGLPAILFCPNATEAFARWLTRFETVTLNPCALDGTWTKYDVKPVALLTALRLTGDSVLWIDSDILIARDFRPTLGSLPPDMLAVTEEALAGGHADPDGQRARQWGMPVGRTLPFTANTGVIRVTPAHRALLEAWHDLLQSDVYRAAQDRPWYERPDHLAGDQEVLTALLASRPFADIPIRFLRRGPDIVQFFGTAGYTLGERLHHLRRGLPYFIHSQGFRPWWPTPRPTSGMAARFAWLYNALSPYTTLARNYAGALEDDSWLKPPSRAARLFGHRKAPLAGLPLAIIADLKRMPKMITMRFKRSPS